jgi:hypothetical protein
MDVGAGGVVLIGTAADQDVIPMVLVRLLVRILMRVIAGRMVRLPPRRTSPRLLVRLNEPERIGRHDLRGRLTDRRRRDLDDGNVLIYSCGCGFAVQDRTSQNVPEPCERERTLQSLRAEDTDHVASSVLFTVVGSGFTRSRDNRKSLQLGPIHKQHEAGSRCRSRPGVDHANWRHRRSF